MAVQLNHTIVRARDKRRSSQFLVDLLGLDPPTAFGPFLVVQVSNDVSDDGGRGVCWLDPDEHGLEVITRPYGG